MHGRSGSLGRCKEAINCCDKAIEINPKYGSAYGNRAFAYFLKKDYDKSWEDVYKAGSLEFKVNPKFLSELKKASARER